jgi:levanase/fructan beta-fructosidase
MHAANYSEPYRGQFHFSSAFGWMNDVDGLWFAEGVYHMTYQADPTSIEQGSNKHWGHATSPDMLRWQQQPFALVPGRDSVGQAWSGSVVVDSENTSGLQRGGAPVFVAIYTDTGIGTALAYSNDLGQTWLPYEGNPLAIGDADVATNRDPTVIWHAPTRQWVCVYWDDGTSFYTSPDLRSWTFASRLDFGHLVPDLYELALESEPDSTRWVLQDAAGSYLVGSFDGRVFEPETPAPSRVDQGPSFYAAHTFFRPTFPDQRVVQIGWMPDGDTASAPFRGSTTFPVELGLRRVADSWRITRTPIAEIAQLYLAEQRWDRHALEPGANLLSGIRSKTFDFEFTLDVAASTAKELTLQIANKAIVYDLEQQLLQGVPLEPQSGIVQLRVLSDWGQLEMFGNGGELSYTESFAFDPDDDSLSMSANGGLLIDSAAFRDLARAWDGSAVPATVVDDSDSATRYSGAWTRVQDDPTYFAGTSRYANDPKAAIEMTFTGTQLEWYGLKNQDLGMADVFIDGQLVAAQLDCYDSVRQPALLFRSQELAPTFHSVRVVPTGQRRPASSGASIVHDFFLFSRAR